jgi:hypothetical protein
VRRTLVLTAILFLAYWFIAARGPRTVGFWQDDAIYVCTAKSLAAGTGYRHIEMPEQPLQTKYPILYPAVLALGFLLGPEYPRNLPCLLAPSALAAAGLVALSLRYWRDVLAGDWWLVVMAAILAVLSPVVLSFVRFTMSDLPFGALALAAVYAFDHKYATAQTGAQQRRWLVIAAVLIALSILTRSIGVTLAGALLVVLAWRKQWRHAGLALAVLAVCVAPWYLRQALAVRANGPLQTAFLIAPDLDYGLCLPSSSADTANVIVQNFFRTAFGLVFFQLALPQQWVQGALATPSGRTVLIHVLGYLALLLIVLGFVTSARPRVRLLQVYAVLYAAMLLAWPFEPYRILLPWTPFLLYFLLCGVREVVRFAMRARMQGRAAYLAAVPVAAVLLALFISDDARIVTSTEREYFLREFPIDWAEVHAVEQWTAQNARPDEVLAAAYAPGLYLATGRQGYYFWPDANPYRLFYGSDRGWKSFCVLPSASESRYVRAQLDAHLPEVYRAAGIRYYIEHRQIDVGEGAMAQYVRAHPEIFTPVLTTRAGNFTVFRVQTPP